MLRTLVLVLSLIGPVAASAQELPWIVPDQFQGAYSCADRSGDACRRDGEFLYLSPLQLVYKDRVCDVLKFDQLRPDKLHFLVKVSCPENRRTVEEWWNLNGQKIILADGDEIWVNLQFNIYTGGEDVARVMRKVAYYIPIGPATN